jgi:hypothetical protein
MKRPGRLTCIGVGKTTRPDWESVPPIINVIGIFTDQTVSQIWGG